MKSQARSLLLVLAVLIAAGCLAWLGWPGRESVAATPPLAEERAVNDARTGPSSENPIDAFLERVDLSESSREAASSSPLSDSAAQAEETGAKVAHLRVLVRDEVDDTPRSGVRVAAFAKDGRGARHVNGPHGQVGEAPVTGADGRVELEVEPRRGLRVWLRDERSSRSTERELGRLDAGESIELVVELGSNVEDLRLFGQLVDTDTGLPLAGFVRIVRQWPVQPLEPLVSTDSAGRFELSAGSLEQVSAVAHAEGHARAVFSVTDGHSDATRPQIVRLDRSASLEAVVRDRMGVPIGGARVELGADSSHLERSSSAPLESLYPFDATRSGETDADGRTTLAALVPRLPLRLSTSASGWPKREEPEPLVFEPGERRSIEIVLGSGANLAGALLDEKGAPIPDRAMWLVAPEGPRPGMFECTATPAQQERTDAAGRFRFEAVPAGTWWIGPAALDPWQADDIPPLATVVEVTNEATDIEIVVRVARGLFLRGTVLDPSGVSAAQCAVHAFLPGGNASQSSATRTDGSFSLGPLPAGTWTIEAGDLNGLHAHSEALEVQAGQTGILLELREGGRIAGVVVDRSTGEGCECEVNLTSADPRSWMGTSSADGTFRFGGLLPQSYAVTARTSDGKIGICRAILVTGGELVEGLRIEISPGSRLDLRYDGPAEHVHCRLFVDGTEFGRASLPGKATEPFVVPPGTIEIRWIEHAATTPAHVQRIDVGADAHVVLRLEAGS